MPLYFYSETLGGTIGVDYSINIQGGISILNSDLEFDNQKQTFVTSSSIYLKSGVEQTAAISYSKEAYSSSYGRLYAGAKFKYINMALSKQVMPLSVLSDEDFSDILEGEYDKNQITSSGYGLDFGLVWDANNYRLGLTLENANSPEFKYGPIGVNCSVEAEQSAARDNCEAASYFTSVTGQINANEVHTKHALLRSWY